MKSSLQAFIGASVVLTFANRSFAQSQLFEWPGEKNYGQIVAAIGDVNGDGKSDVAIVFGDTFAPHGGSIDVRSGHSGFPLYTVPSQYSGFWEVFATSLCAIGDVNSDGAGDFLVGSGVGGVPKPGQAQGHARVLSGSSGGTLFELSSGYTYDETFGSRITGIGDVNGDGHDDFLVGNSYPGLLRLYSGANGSILFEKVAAGWLGALAGGRDFNLDGIPDYVIGHSTGLTQVSGATGAEIATIHPSPSPEKIVLVEDTQGDGVPDLWVSDSYDYYGQGAGWVALLSGLTGATLFQVVGSAPGDHFGAGLTSLGDVDGDGIADVAAGTRIGPYLAGFPGGYVRYYSSTTGVLLGSFVDVDTDRWFGSTLSSGDVNGDALLDIVIGAPGPSGYWVPGKSSVAVHSFAPGLSQYGVGSPGCAGVHDLNASQPPVLGSSHFRLVCGAAPPTSLGLALVCDASAGGGGIDPFGIGVALHVDLFAASEILALDMSSDASSVGTTLIAIPSSPALAGKTYFAQAIWRWGSGCVPSALGLSSSVGLAIELLPH